MTSETMMKEAPVWKLILKMSLPMVVVMLMNVVYNMADVFFMGQTGDSLQVAAVSLAGPVFGILSGVNVLIGSGACTAIAIALGGGETERVKRYMSFSFWTSLVLGIIACAAILLGMEPLLSLLGANAETAGFTRDYLRILALGAPVTIVGGVLGNAVRADGSATAPMLFSIGGNLINIVLDFLFVLVFHWGTSGAALATVFGSLFSLVCILFLLRRKKAFSISPKYFSLRPSVSLRVLSLGIPMAAGVILQGCSGMFSNQLLVKYGNTAVAASSVAGKSGMLIGMVLMGICMGIQPAISYLYGVGNWGRIRKIVRETGFLTVLFSLGMAAAFFLTRDSFMAAFLDDPQVIKLGRTMMLASLITAPVTAVYQLCSAYLQGIGKVTPATVASLLRQGLAYVPALYLMERVLGLPGVIFAGSVADVISCAVSCTLCLVGAKNTTAAPAHRTVPATRPQTAALSTDLQN